MNTNKTLLLSLGIILSLATPVLSQDKGDKVPPGLQKKGGVPPGLQKKGGVPPGKAKKHVEKTRGQEEIQEVEEKAEPATDQPKIRTQKDPPSETKTSTPTPTPEPPKTKATPGPAPEPLTPTRKVSAEGKRRQANLETAVQSLNQLATQPQGREVVLKVMHKHFRLSESEVAAEQTLYPELGLADLYAAHHISKRSKQPVSKLVAHHRAGASWGVMAAEYGAGLPDLLDTTRNMEKAAQRTVHGSR